jgi:hypothetical protein
VSTKILRVASPFNHASRQDNGQRLNHVRRAVYAFNRSDKPRADDDERRDRGERKCYVGDESHEHDQLSPAGGFQSERPVAC